jgi:hypothetical protein
LRAGSDGYVFRDGTEVCAGGSSAGHQVWFAWELMRQSGLLCHHFGMLGGCLGQCRIPLERLQTLLSTVCVGQLHHLLLGCFLGHRSH